MADKISAFLSERLPERHKKLDGSKTFRTDGYMPRRYIVWEPAPPRACPTAEGLELVSDAKLRDPDLDDTVPRFYVTAHTWPQDCASVHHVILGPVVQKEARKVFNRLVRQAAAIEKKNRDALTLNTPGDRMRGRLAGGTEGIIGALATLVESSDANNGVIWKIASERDTWSTEDAVEMTARIERLKGSSDPNDAADLEHIEKYDIPNRYQIRLNPVFAGVINPKDYRPMTKTMDGGRGIKLINITDLGVAYNRLKEVVEEHMAIMTGGAKST